MSDFHRSLDRAINSRCDYWAIDETTAYDPHTDWGLSGDALGDLMAARDLMERQPSRPPVSQWPDVGYVNDEIVDIRKIQDKINAGIKRLAQIALSPAIFESRGPYGIRWRDPEIVRPLSDMESLMAELESPVHEAVRRYQRYYSNAAVTFLAGVDWDSFVVGTPLCDQDIPAEGVE